MSAEAETGGLAARGHPFDAVAPTYDEDFARSRLGRLLRGAVHRHLRPLVVPGARVLDLGCGTAEDAVWMAGRGVRVTATDASPGMLEVAASKVEAAGLVERIDVTRLDLREPDSGLPPAADPPFDVVLANFGVLNCVPDRRSLAVRLAGWVRPGGHLAVVVMSRICPWEVFWHLTRGRVRTAFRRRDGARAHVGDGRTIRVWYPGPATLRDELAPAFAQVRTVGVGVLLPPSYLGGLVDRWPALFDRLARWEARLETRWPWNRLGDHYLSVYRRRTR